jgi:DNA repair photolyase
LIRFDGDLVARVLELKARVRSSLEGALGRREIEEASRDSHARRRPVPCGMTVHTGVGCGYGCLYCYVYDMGFPPRPAPYPLSGPQLAYALALNPYVVPGEYGTLLAFGSVTEPFSEVSTPRTLEYFRYLRDYLGNPQQVSTKSPPPSPLDEEFRRSADPRVDVLLTVTTLRYWRVLEPGAPSPVERFERASRLVRAGICVTLFLRPILPGVTDREVGEILDTALSYGIRRVVPGTLRVTPRILARLTSAGVVDVGEVERRLPRYPRGGGDQVTIRGSDLKGLAVREASRRGMEVFPASCASSISSHGQSCAACSMGPCGNVDRLPEVSEGGVAEASKVLGVRVGRVEVRGFRVLAECRDRPERCDVLRYYLIALARRTPLVRRAA